MFKASVMVVDDESIVLADLQMTLQRLGYGVLVKASSGKEAVQLAEIYKPDLVLMDIVMPGEMDGIEAASQIRTRFDIPVIYVTAYADEALMERVKSTVPFGYVIKPFNERDLLSNIELALYKHGMEKTLKEQLDTTKRMNKLFVDRELKMEELRKENAQLKKKNEGQDKN